MKMFKMASLLRKKVWIFVVLLFQATRGVLMSSNVASHTTGHVQMLIEVQDFWNPFQVGDNNSTGKCCKTGGRTDCDTNSTCNAMFSLCIGRQVNLSCNGTLLFSTTESSSDAGFTVFKFPVANLQSWTKTETITVTMFNGTKALSNVKELTPDLAELAIDTLSSKVEADIDVDFWSSTQHLVSMTRCASVALGFRLFCESSHYGPNCQNFAELDEFHHVEIKNNEAVYIWDCQQEGMSVITIVTDEPYTYTPPILKRNLTIFLIDRVCRFSTKVVNLTIINVRYTSGRLRVAFQAFCMLDNWTPITDLEVHHALNFMTPAELTSYFMSEAERTDETRYISAGRFNIVYRILEFHGPANATNLLEMKYLNESDVKWRMSGRTEKNYCFAGMRENNTTNTVHILSHIIPEETEPLKLNVYEDSRQTVVSYFDIPVLNYSISSPTGNSFRHFFLEELEITNNSSNYNLTIQLFVWCTTGYHGHQCDETCPTNDTVCNYEKCVPLDDHHVYVQEMHCAKGLCENTTCICNPGYYGPQCRSKVDKCYLGWTDIPCQDGTYRSSYDGYHLNLTNERNSKQGQNNYFRTNNNARILKADTTSERSISCASRSFACGNGTVFQQNNNVSCLCDHGYKGELCDKRDYCASAPCLNGGKCENKQDNFTCQCRGGYYGEICDAIDLCASAPCLNNRKCENKQDNFTCQCSRGYHGDICDATDFCASAPCLNGGKCENKQDNFTCQCSRGYYGDICDAIDFCASAPCLNGGKCENKQDNFTCHCSDGYYGVTCEIINTCSERTCKLNSFCINLTEAVRSQKCDLNHCKTCCYGTYINQDNIVSCVCDHGYRGERCDEKDFCASAPCLHGGDCENKQDNFTCHCSDGYYGVTCEIINTCSERTCKVNSSCINLKNPEKSKQCDLKNCMVCCNGTLIHQGDNVSCLCDHGYRGERCDEIDYCAPAPCYNGGKCENKQDNFTCQCSDDFYGDTCDLINNCYENTCSNNATCINLTSSQSYKCLCTDHYFGERCESRNFCESQPCLNGAACENMDEGFRCNCTEDYIGYTCNLSRKISHGSSQYVYMIILPAITFEQTGSFNLTSGLQVIVQNVTRVCHRVYIKPDLVVLDNGSLALYTAVFCDGKLLNSSVIKQGFESYKIIQLLEILHLTPTHKLHTVNKHSLITDYWVVLTGAVTGTAALLVGLSAAVCITIRTRRINEKSYLLTRQRPPSTGVQRYVKSRRSLTRGHNSSINKVKPVDQFGRVSTVDQGFEEPVNFNPAFEDLETSVCESVAIDDSVMIKPQQEHPKIKKGGMRYSAMAAVGRSPANQQHSDNRPSRRHSSYLPGRNSEYRRSFLESKMNFLSRNPLYGLSEDWLEMSH